ncbi:hypothetical protein SAY86_008880 [Trapa natans]|uniref:Uncharacterized protein n=1 Tax=Trapa natans TaxID=22666 RepID=A0AAN7QBQ4_TRANT|nr:hypothetical protein SAY86_008880 [Trapa natans]
MWDPLGIPKRHSFIGGGIIKGVLELRDGTLLFRLCWQRGHLLMAPKGRTSRRRSKRNSRRAVTPPEKPRRTAHLKKTLRKPESPDVSVSAGPSSSDEYSKPEIHADAETGGSCSTPKGRRFRIPAINTCPPAPKKQRVAPKNCLLQKRRHVAFFAHPDIEIFFNIAFRGISV